MNATAPNSFSLRHHYIGVLAANSFIMDLLFFEAKSNGTTKPAVHVARRLGEIADALIAIADEPAAVATEKA